MSDTSTDPLARNRLDEEGSPYLQQHADNPVNWQPWDETALRAARERDKPIFLSVGYSSCHWCHVMAEESFEDESVAEILNESFVPIKVDREERPDVDSIYQTIGQLMGGRGGWPLSVWLTPEQEPFYVGTYFPKEPRRGSPGFLELLAKTRDSFANDREEVEERAEQWTEAIEGELESTPDHPGEVGEDVIETAANAAMRSADREYGGFGAGGGPKFPQPGRLHLLLRANARTGRDPFADVVDETLAAMADGGIYDHLGGGFHRYSTDREWVVPHFEKMLYDNAEIPRLFLTGYQRTGNERYADVAAETLAFCERELRHDEGSFFSTLDARSPPPDDPEAGDEEGAFYTWTPAEVHDAVADEQAAELFCDRFGVTEAGNFERTTVLTISESVADLAERYDTTVADVEATLSTAREYAFSARAERPRPARDEKILASWNGLLVSAFAEAGLALDPSYAETAAAALSFCREHLYDGNGGLSRRYKDGEVTIDGYLEDYAFLARGAFDTYQASGELDHLAFAMDLATAMVDRFYDESAGTLYFTPASGEALVARPQELGDQSTPASAGVAADLLLSLSHFRPDDRFEEVAGAVLDTHADRIEGSPVQHASLVLAADRYTGGSTELTIAAESVPEAWRERIGETYLPARILAPRPPTADGLRSWLDRLGFEDAPPIWADRDARDGDPTVYACRDFSCSPPKHDVDAALSWLSD